MKHIAEIRYNWYPVPDSQNEWGYQSHPEGMYTYREIGVNGVTKIEFMDKIYCLIYFDDGHTEIQFNLNCIVFEGVKNEGS